MSFHCKQCDSALAWAPQATNAFTQYCVLCKTCSACGELISQDDVAFSLLHSLEKLTHVRCLLPEALSAIVNKRTSVDVTPKELDLINFARLGNLDLDFVNLLLKIHEVKVELSIETQCEALPILAERLYKDLSPDEKFVHLRKMETLTIACSILLKKENKKKIQLEINEREREKYEAAALHSKKNIKGVCPKCKRPFPEAALIEHKKTCVGNLSTPEGRKVRQVLTDYEKSVRSFMAIGLSREDAEASAKSAIAKGGRVVPEIM